MDFYNITISDLDDFLDKLLRNIDSEHYWERVKLIMHVVTCIIISIGLPLILVAIYALYSLVCTLRLIHLLYSLRHVSAKGLSLAWRLKQSVMTYTFTGIIRTFNFFDINWTLNKCSLRLYSSLLFNC